MPVDLAKFFGFPFETGDVVEDRALGNGSFVGVIDQAEVYLVFSSFLADSVVLGGVGVGGSVSTPSTPPRLKKRSTLFGSSRSAAWQPVSDKTKR